MQSKVIKISLAIIAPLIFGAWGFSTPAPKFVKDGIFAKSADSAMQTSAATNPSRCGPSILKDHPDAKCYMQSVGIAHQRQFVTAGGKVVLSTDVWDPDYINRDAVPTVVQVVGSDAPKYITKARDRNNVFKALYVFSGGTARVDTLCPYDGKQINVSTLRECKVTAVFMMESPESAFAADQFKQHDFPF